MQSNDHFVFHFNVFVLGNVYNYLDPLDNKSNSPSPGAFARNQISNRSFKSSRLPHKQSSMLSSTHSRASLPPKHESQNVGSIQKDVAAAFNELLYNAIDEYESDFEGPVHVSQVQISFLR